MTVPTPATSGRIFISYRREDTAYSAGWLFDRLANHFGRGQVFKDVDSIEPGDDFVEVVTTAVGSCAVLLVLIGDQWLTVCDEDGRRRIDNPEDFVRLEIEAALARNVRVIPILIGGSRPPRVDELPPSLAGLARRQALDLNPSRFNFEVEQLLRQLDGILIKAKAPRSPSETPGNAESPGSVSNLKAHDQEPQTQFQVVTLPDRSAVKDEDLPLMIEGNYSGDMGSGVRVILEDSYGQYYVQNPEVKFLSDGTWRATNILPGDGIMFVHFIKLDHAAKLSFDRMVERHAFGAFREIPTSSQILRSVRIYRMTQR